MPQIRQANDADIAEIVEVVNAAFEVEREFRAGNRTSAAEIARLMRSSTFLIATHDGRVAGAVLVRITGAKDGAKDGAKGYGAIGYFGMLAVHPQLQRLGIGRALLEASENYCREHGCTEMTLSTGSVRRELLDRYARLGYSVTSIEPAPPDGPFTKQIEIVKMAKRL